MMKTMFSSLLSLTVTWHDQGSETVRQRLRDVGEAHGMIQEVGSRGRAVG